MGRAIVQVYFVRKLTAEGVVYSVGFTALGCQRETEHVAAAVCPAEYSFRVFDFQFEHRAGFVERNPDLP